MKRLANASIFAQAMALVIATAIASQLVTLTWLNLLPGGSEPFTFDDVASLVRTGVPVDREGQSLVADVLPNSPEEWEIDGTRERRARVTLAAVLGVAPERVLIEDQIPLPGGQWLIQWGRRSTDRPLSDFQPSPDGGDWRLGDLAAAIKQDDGRWAVIYPPADWPGPGLLILLLLAGNLLILVPLAWLFTRRLVAPIRTFADTADRAGHGDTAAVFQVSGPSEIRTAAQALSEMQRRISGAAEERTKLLAAIAHDLRTPLTRLRYRAEQVPDQTRDRMVEDIERMDGMIGGVLAFVRGEHRVERVRLDFAALVQSTVDDWADSGARVSVDCLEAAEVDADPIALRRLITNLIDNAINYAGGGRCNVRREGYTIVLQVDDDGPGLPDDALERMFEPFERGDSTRDPATGGVGLGLALAREITRAHGGTMWLSNRPEGGLRASVRLPAAND